MPKVQLPFVGGSYTMKALQLDAQSCINWYEVIDPNGKYKTALLPRPGLLLFADDNNEDSVRGMLSLNDNLYVVIDNHFYIYTSDRSRTIKGTLSTFTGLVDIKTNDYQIFITDGFYGYVYQIAQTQYHDADTFFIITNSSSTIGTIEFVGGGLNDMSAEGPYGLTTPTNYKVLIDLENSPDTFRWSKDDGNNWVATSVPMTGSYQPLDSGIQIKFNVSSGHTISNYWTFTANAVPATVVTFTGSGTNDLTTTGIYTGALSAVFRVQIDSVGSLFTPDTFKWSKDGGATWFANNVSITGNDQALSDGISIKLGRHNHTLDNYWDLTLGNGVTVPVFSGSGLNDLQASGEYNGDVGVTFRVVVDGVASPNTFRWSIDGGATYIGTGISMSTSPVELMNGFFISFRSITGHSLGNYWNIPITVSSSFYAPIIAAYQDGFGIYPRQQSERFYASEINDFSRVNALSYASANVYPDNLSLAISMHQELYLIGTDTIEVWYNTGAQSFAFNRRSNFIINYGCEAPFTAKFGANNVLFMLSRNATGTRMVIKIDNYNVSVVSTEPLNDEFRSYSTVSDAFAYITEFNNHTFYVLTFPTADRTWVYDLSTNLWSEWRSLRDNTYPQPTRVLNGRFRGSCHAVFGGKNIIGDTFSGKLFELNENTFFDLNKQIYFERTGTHFSDNDNWLSLNMVRIDVEAGSPQLVPPNNLENSPYAQPKLMLSISKDGGYSYGSEMWRTSGTYGQYKYRALWYALGTSRMFTFKLRVTDSAYNVVLSAIADIEENSED